MAPFPEEVDVFTIPHGRMKQLVDRYLERIKTTNFTNDEHMTILLTSLHKTFTEFKAHEQIENEYIMKTLKRKMSALHVTNTAVCNCHSDNRLAELLDFFKEGLRYRTRSEADRMSFGSKLKDTLDEFTEHFLPHMQEEEEVFQPLLIKYFDYDELCALKEAVIREHFQRKEKEQYRYRRDEKLDCEKEDSESLSTAIDALPAEVIIKVFSYLDDPRDLAQCAQVNRQWTKIATDPVLWRHLYPTKWAHGHWTFNASDIELDSLVMGNHSDECYLLDDDADVDEACDEDEDDDMYFQMKKEAKMFSGIAKYLLPKVGRQVERLDLGYSKGITNVMVYKMLKLCPNVVHLDLSHTRINDMAFKGFAKNKCGTKLRTLVLAGCENIGDISLAYIAESMATQVYLDLPEKKNKNKSKSANLQKTKTSSQPTNLMNGNTCVSYSSQITAEMLESFFTELDENANINDSGYRQISPEVQRKNLKNAANAEASSRHSNADNVQLTPEACVGPIQPLPMLRTKCCRYSELTKLVHNPKLGQDHDDMISRRDTLQNVHVFNTCHQVCRTYSQSDVYDSDKESINSIESCDDITGHVTADSPSMLEFLDLSGCHHVSDGGLQSLVNIGGLPNLKHLDLSGCPNITGEGLTSFVEACPSLAPEDLYYCDNIIDGPYVDTANGCQNLNCTERHCCRN